MKLFAEIEKCFPEMRKHHMEWVSRNPMLNQTQAKSEMILWIEENYLQEQSRIYQLFLKAGVQSRLTMANEMLIWHIYDWNLEMISRADTSPVRGSARQSEPQAR